MRLLDYAEHPGENNTTLAEKSNKFLPELRERAVRTVQEHRGKYPSLWGLATARA